MLWLSAVAMAVAVADESCDTQPGLAGKTIGLSCDNDLVKQS